jgi:hypothetical protein
MRYVFPVVLVAALGGCAYDSPAPSAAAAPPTVAYPVYGSDFSRPRFEASRYCRSYGASAQYQGTQQSSSGPMAVFTCTGPRVASSRPIPAPPPYPPAYEPGYPPLCADPMHQNRPGGSDYRGPPVPECMPPR